MPGAARGHKDAGGKEEPLVRALVGGSSAGGSRWLQWRARQRRSRGAVGAADPGTKPAWAKAVSERRGLGRCGELVGFGRVNVARSAQQ